MKEEKSFTSSPINWYPGHMAKTKRLIKENLNYIDVVYEIIDSRIPYSSKIPGITNITSNKTRILIFTKYDLCDKIETDKWIKYYQKQGYHVLPCDLTKDNMKSLINLTLKITDINQKREEKGMKKRRLRALIIGIPNVGKSTLINKLVSKKVTQTGNMPGVTKNLNWIKVSSDIELLDTPGILWPKIEEEKVGLNLASLTAIKEEILPLDEVVYYILTTLYKYYPNILKERYDIESIDDYVLTLNQIGQKRGCLIKGGKVDYDKVYSLILKDIKDGIIKNITLDKVSDYE